jgi:hypothetical protein
MAEEEPAKPKSFVDYWYTIFNKSKYRQIILPAEHEQSWRDMGGSYVSSPRRVDT